METLIAVLITSATSIFTTIIAIVINGRINNNKVTQEIKTASELSDSKLDSKIDKYSELTDMKIKQLSETTNIQIKRLTDETRLHNNFAQKIPVIESRVERLERELHNG